MKLTIFASRILTTLLVAVLLVSPSSSETLSVTRADGTIITYYLDLPSVEPYPMAVILQGSECLRVSHKYEEFISQLNDSGVAVMRVEKPGLSPDVEIGECPQEYLDLNTPQQRVLDLLEVLGDLRRKQAQWNGKFGLIGGSEGALVAAMAAPSIPETQAVALLSGGGGIPFYEEAFLGWIRQLVQQGWEEEEIKAKVSELYGQLEEVLQNPQRHKEWMSDGELARNTHLWWTKVARLDLTIPLVRIDAPVLILHGKDDLSVPVEGAVDLQKRLAEEGKSDVELRLYEGGHKPPKESVKKVLEWVSRQLKNEA